MSDSYILFLCGGRWQVPWIQFLKNKGHRIILVDPNENTWCSDYADTFFKSDVKDVEAIWKFIKVNSYPISCVTSEQTDVSTIPVAILSERLGTPCIPVEVVKKFTDKYLSKKHASTINKNHVPAFTEICSPRQLIEFVNTTGSTCIVKPSDSQSSRGISILQPGLSESNAHEKFENALRYGTNDYVIAEEFITGTEITVEGIVLSGKHFILATSRKKHFRTGIASELAYPLITESQLLNSLTEYHNKVVESTGIPFGITHTEYIIDEKTGSFHLIEMACRGGGSLIPSTIAPWVSNVDIYDLHYRQLLGGEKITALPHTLASRSAILHFLEFPAGKVKSISGLEACREIAGIHTIDLEFKPGDTIYPAADDRGRQGFLIVLANTEDESRRIIEEVYNRLKVITE
jgi:biotin carboxylase